MSRLFDGTDDVMTYGAAAPGAGSAAHTLLIVAKNVSGTSWASLVEREASGGSLVQAIGRRSNGNLYYAPTSGIQDGGSTVAITATTTWWVLAVTHPGGTGTPRYHKVNVGGGSPVHVNGSSTTPGGTAARVKIGGDDDFANFLIAAAAVWHGTALADADIEGIATDATTQSIADLSPTWLVDDSDAFATDLIGTADRTAITGTADNADDPPSWVYGLGGGPTEHERSAAIAATAAVTVANREFFSIFERSAAVAATTAITSAPQRELLRQTALASTTAITVAAYQRELLRQAAIAATGAITAAGEVESAAGEHERSASLAATAAIATAYQRDLLRQTAVTATGLITSSPQRELLRTSALTATGLITAAGFVGDQLEYPLNLEHTEPARHATHRETGAVTNTETAHLTVRA